MCVRTVKRVSLFAFILIVLVQESICTTCTVFVQHVQYLYNMYSICTTCTVFVQHVLYLYNMYSICTTCTIFAFSFYLYLLCLKFASPCIIIQFNLINQLDATISQVYYLTFVYSSACFGRPHARHQELNNCSSSLWFYHWSVLVAVLLVVVGPAGRPRAHHQELNNLQQQQQQQPLVLPLERGGSSAVGRGRAGRPAILAPIIRSSTTAVAASGFTVGAWWQQCCWSWSGRPAVLAPIIRSSTAVAVSGFSVGAWW